MNTHPMFFYLIGILLAFSIGCSGNESGTYQHTDPHAADTLAEVDSTTIYQTTYQKGIDSLSQLIDSLHKQGLFNGAYLIAKGPWKLSEAYLGYANFSANDTINPDTRFQVASITKPFTALAILLLYEEGKLDIHHDVRTYLPEFPYAGITLEMLMSHTSGLGEYIFFMDKIWTDKHVPLTNDSLYKWMVQQQPRVFRKPGIKYEYNNLGFALLATIVEKVSGISYPQFLQQHIFDPCKMNHTFVWQEGHSNPSSIAAGYAANMGDPGNDFLNGVYGDKGMFSTVTDLHRFSDAFFHHRILKNDDTYAQMLEPHCEVDADSATYGLGWRIIYPNSSMRIVHHTGWWDGYRSNLVYFEKEDITLVINTNWYKGPFFNHAYLKRFVNWFNKDITTDK